MYTLRRPLAGAAVAALAGLSCAASAQEHGQARNGEATVLPKLVIFGLELSAESLLGGGDASETGVTVLNGKELENRSDGSGDINAVLKTLPNVQWQNDATSDGGTSLAREQDLRPLEVSISGGKIYDNNFLLDGVEINRIDGSMGDAADLLEDNDQRPNLNNVYGGHSQSVYVPPEILDSVVVRDSNVSAEYGRFQGGIVEYTTKSPAMDRIHGGFSASYQSSDMVNYHIATEDGTNPNDRKPPEFYKDRESFWLSGPLNERWGAMASVSRSHSWGEKQRAYQYVEQADVETESFSETYLAKLTGDTDIGRFVLQSVYTPYRQDWDSSEVLQGAVSVLGNGSSSLLGYSNDFGDWGVLKGVSVSSQASLNLSHTGRDGETDTSYNYSVTYPDAPTPFVATGLDMCRPDPTNPRTFCRIGTYGDLYQDQQDLAYKFQSKATLFGNALKVGGGAKRVDVMRERPQDVVFYSTTTRQTEMANPISCADPDDETCIESTAGNEDGQYFDRRNISPAYRRSAHVANFDLFAEYAIDWGRLDLDLGLRADYETYQQNLNVAPRLSASLEAFKGVTLTGGYGRYYANSMLAYAIRDAIPRSYNETRTDAAGVVSSATGGPGGWSDGSSASSNSSLAEDLRTPYTDEFSVGVAIEDPLLGGMLRLKGLRRFGRDQFARKENSSGSPTFTGINTLTNDGVSEYTSASLEYAKVWNGLDWGLLESVGLSGSLTWADRSASNDTYYGDNDDDIYIYYKGVSYNGATFGAVTGNLDIPIRATLALNTVLWDGRLDLWTNANVTFGYTGVIDSGSNITFAGFVHDVYEDYRYKPTVTFNAGGTLTVAENRYGKADLEFRIDNVLDDIGNANASTSYPYKRGRSYWAGLNYTF